jgi:hypothetical protein
MVYHALTEFLLAKKRRSYDFYFVLGLVLFLALLIARTPLRVVLVLLLGTILGFVFLILERRRIAKLEGSWPLTYKWIATLRSFAERRQLEDRSHPDLVPDLEACARLRNDVLTALESPSWLKLRRQSNWDRVCGLCVDAAERLLIDALWAARPLFRSVGARRATFAKRCEDHAYTYQPLATVGLVRKRLEHLYDVVSSYPLETLSSARALQEATRELDAIREAEREIGLYG